MPNNNNSNQNRQQQTARNHDNNNNRNNNNNRRNNNNNNNRLQRNKVISHNNNSKFTGCCDALKGHIFDCSSSQQADQYVNTHCEIEKYIGHTFTYGNDTKWSLENLQKYTIDVPEAPPASSADNEVY